MDINLRHIDILLFNRVDILEVAGAVQTFMTVNELGQERYRLRYISMDGTNAVTTCGMPLGVSHVASTDGYTQDLLIPGGQGVNRAIEDGRIQSFIAKWPSNGKDRRIISICSGALLVAQSGLLDGRVATTHWAREAQAQREFPKVAWAIDRLYCVDKDIFTSAGVTSGIDLALDIVRKDCGASVALAVARHLVVYLKRDGGQSQFSDLLDAQFAENKYLTELLEALLTNPARNWTLEKMAEEVNLTPRTLRRRFSKDYGKSPCKFLERIRVKRAADALSGGAPIGKAIDIAGFTDFQQMQRAFKRQLGITVGTYKARFDGLM